MFLDFYDLHEQPFGGAPDPRFLYFGASHREALASLFYGIKSDCAFTALIAEPGMGKTTLAYQLLEKLQPLARTIFLCQTQCSSRELLQYILSELGSDARCMETVSMHNELREIISTEVLAGRRFIIAIDEAQNLDPDVLETVRLLSNVQTSRGKLLQILLIGQPQLAHKLASSALMQLQQRISVFARIEPLGLEEAEQYISHRLKLAGHTGNRLFQREAVAIIHSRSRGIPRMINNLCFNALSLGCSTQSKQIDSKIMREVLADIEAVCVERPSRTPDVAMAPVLQRTAGPPTPKSSFKRFVVGKLAVAACVATAVGAVAQNPGTGRLLWHIMGESPVFVRPSDASSLLKHTSAVGPLNPNEVLTVKKTAMIAPIFPVESSSISGVAETTTAVVEPGDTLRQIALRTLGRYNDTILEQIQILNAGISDPNHIEVGQQITLPWRSRPFEASLTVGTASTNAKN